METIDGVKVPVTRAAQRRLIFSNFLFCHNNHQNSPRGEKLRRGTDEALPHKGKTTLSGQRRMDIIVRRARQDDRS
jgi:hypothetical protein